MFFGSLLLFVIVIIDRAIGGILIQPVLYRFSEFFLVGSRDLNNFTTRDEKVLMKVVMVGTGYVGLVSGACFAELGANVICVDKDKNKIDRLISGEIPMYEPGLEELVSKNVKTERLSFTTNLEDSISTADLVFIAVGTPTRRGDGHADLKYVYAAAEELAPHLSSLKWTPKINPLRQNHLQYKFFQLERPHQVRSPTSS